MRAKRSQPKTRAHTRKPRQARGASSLDFSGLEAAGKTAEAYANSLCDIGMRWRPQPARLDFSGSLYARAKELQLVENDAHWREVIETFEQPGRIEMEFPDDPHSSIEKYRTLFLRMARESEKRIDDELLALPADDAPALESWARRWNLHADWVLERARRVLLDEDKAAWALPIAIANARFSPPAPEPWHPDRTSRHGYMAYIEKYLDHVASAARAAGMTHVPLDKHEPNHFHWLIRYKIRRESCAEITKSAFPTSTPRNKDVRYKTVYKAMGDLAKAIGLPFP